MSDANEFRDPLSAAVDGDWGITRPRLARVLNGSHEEQIAHPDSDQLNETVVIVHQVSPEDSLPGVALRYGITLSQLRRANSLWASDSIHLRKVLYIPLHSSNVPNNALIHRVSTSELSFFPPAKVHTPTADPPPAAAATSGSIFDPIIARLSFDSVSSDHSEQHELHEVRLPDDRTLKPRRSLPNIYAPNVIRTVQLQPSAAMHLPSRSSPPAKPKSN